MAFSFAHSIIPMSELRSDPEKIKRKLKKSPIIITNNGRPDFGVCDLETLEIANRVKELRDTLFERSQNLVGSENIDDVFKEFNKKYGF